MKLNTLFLTLSTLSASAAFGMQPADNLLIKELAHDKTAHQAAKNFKALACTNKALNSFVNKNTEAIADELAKTFNISFANTLTALRTQKAQEWLHSQSDLEKLPAEILLHIFKQLPLQEAAQNIRSCMRVNKSVKALLDDEKVHAEIVKHFAKSDKPEYVLPVLLMLHTDQAGKQLRKYNATIIHRYLHVELVNNLHAAQFILKYAPLSILDVCEVYNYGQEKTNLLIVSVCLEKTQLVKLLIQYGADVNYQTMAGHTALHIAARHGSSDIIKLLLACPRTDVTIKDAPRMTVLMHGCLSGKPEVVKLLLSNPLIKQSINMTNACGLTAIKEVRYEDNLENKDIIMKILLENGSK